MLKRIKWFVVLMSVQCSAYAADLFATGWGQNFNSSPEGQLFFTLMELFGIWTCMKSLILVYRFAHNQSKHGYWTCFTIFMAGSLIYFMHGTLNLIYNSF